MVSSMILTSFVLSALMLTYGSVALQCTEPTSNPYRVGVSTWKTSDCSRDPIAINYFSLTNDLANTCDCWPGSSGENSGSRYQCSTSSEEFTMTQWTAFQCQGGVLPEGKVKTFSTTECRQDTPPSLYTRISYYDGCYQNLTNAPSPIPDPNSSSRYGANQALSWMSTLLLVAFAVCCGLSP